MSSDLHAASAAYVDALPLAERRRSGTVYTPEPLVAFILDKAGCTGESLLEGGPILDPACGGGVFLCEVLRRVAKHIGGGALLRGKNKQKLIAFAKRNLYGVDVDPHARELTIEVLCEEMERLAPGALPKAFLETNVVVSDFLLGDAASSLPPVRRGGFAFIIGNPPYVSTTRLDSRQKTALRTMFSTAVGRVDLYTLFFERSIQLLRADGVIAFITPDKFLANETSKSLRQYLLRHASVRSIARFDSHKVFPDAAVVPCVTVIDRAQREEIEVLSCHAGRGEPVRVLSSSRSLRATLSAAPWQFRSADLLEIVERLRAGCPTLADLAARISAGPATGRDELFVRPRGELVDVEQALLRPAVRGRDIAAFSIADSGLDVLLPFDFTLDQPKLISLAKYPRARRYLERHRRDLEARHCVRVWEKAWFDLHDSPTLDIAGQTKILVPDVAESCRFAVDRGKFFPLHSAYYAILHDVRAIDFVTALLNSKVVEFMLRLLAPIAKDGFSRFRRQFLAAIPIPMPDAKTRREIVRASRSEDLNDRVARLFCVSTSDRRAIADYLEGRTRGGFA